MNDNFTWIDIYNELALKLRDWEDRQQELIALLVTLQNEGNVITSLRDQNKDGERFLLEEIDPFTFLGVFNRGITDDNRLAILSRMKEHFRLRSPLPTDFNGIPVLNNQSSWFFRYQIDRRTTDIPRLWRVFQLAFQEDPIQDATFLQALDDALDVKQVNVNLTMGLFWIRPDVFLSLDSRNRSYLDIKLPGSGLSANYYADTLKEIAAREMPFVELSRAAWLASSAGSVSPPPEPPQADRAYWLVGAYWDGSDPPDQTQRFLDEGIWENGYEDRLQDEVNAMRVGDKIAIKAAFTQRKGLPFDARDETVSRMDIKATGTIVANRYDGRVVEVEWDPQIEPRRWYFFTNRSTIWRLKTTDDYRHREYSQRLIEFVWEGKDQDYAWFSERWWGEEGPGVPGDDPGSQPYNLENMIAEGVFLEERELRQMLNRLRAKKAMILQGSPGVGKTYIARKLAYALMQEIDSGRLEMVQFHQSYSYDDFVRGYRPLPAKGGFGLQNGVFFDFCKKAAQDPEREYVFIIDEINRGNLSLIFGELLMLIEGDKRGPEFAVPLVYREEDTERFHIPANVYLLGLMNIADRSLAMVDYALRRRFAFVTLQPQFEGPRFRQWLLDRSMPSELVDLIATRMSALNREIKDDALLGANYQIGHSYFCPKGSDFSGLDRAWFVGIVETEIAPLLREYWFDNWSKADEMEQALLVW